MKDVLKNLPPLVDTVTVKVGVRLEFGNYPTLRFSSLTGDFVPLIGNP